MEGFKPKKEDPKKEEPKKEDPKKEDPKKEINKIDVDNKDVGSGNIFLDTLLSPFSIANDITSGVGKEIKKSFKEDYGGNKRLTEQIDKIKKIIKH